MYMGKIGMLYFNVLFQISNVLKLSSLNQPEAVSILEIDRDREPEKFYFSLNVLTLPKTLLLWLIILSFVSAML